MSKPRIFISSTYYDLKNVRADLERFIKEMGYDPVLNERGNIPYNVEPRLEDGCYKEIGNCDILLSIIGGRFGTNSESHPYSISQRELKTAIEHGKPVYIFVEKSVFAEYRTYLKNKENESVKYDAVDNVRIYNFLEEINSLQNLQPIASFETSRDIIDFLKEQWSGLFQRLLQTMARQKEIDSLQDLKTGLATLNQLISYITEERKTGNEAIKQILTNNHPLFEALRKKLEIKYRIYFTTKEELNQWILAHRGDEADGIFIPTTRDDCYEWIIWQKDSNKSLMIKKTLFDASGILMPMQPSEWKEDFLILEDLSQQYKNYKEQIRDLLRKYGQHSFEWFRQRVPLSNEQFLQIIADYPEDFKLVSIRNDADLSSPRQGIALK